MLQFLCRGAGALATRGLLTQSSGRRAWEADTQSKPKEFTLQTTQLKTVKSFKKWHYYFRNLEIGGIRLHPDRVIGLEASNVHRRFARLMIFQDSSPKRIVHFSDTSFLSGCEGMAFRSCKGEVLSREIVWLQAGGVVSFGAAQPTRHCCILLNSEVNVQSCLQISFAFISCCPRVKPHSYPVKSFSHQWLQSWP